MHSSTPHTSAGLPSGIQVDVTDTQRVVADIDPARLAGLVHRTLEREQVSDAEISLFVVDDARIRQINREHMDHDWETDVITFPLSAASDDTLSGELVISAEMAQTTAQAIGIATWNEVALYVIHGLLHLVGFDDLTEEAAAAMRSRESFHLDAEGLENPFALGAALVPSSGKEGEPCRS